MELKTSASKKITHTAFEVQIDSEAGKIKLSEWEKELGLVAPFTIDEVDIFIDTLDGAKVNASVKVDASNGFTTYEDIAFTLRATPNNAIYGLDITASSEHSMRIQFKTVVHLAKKDVRPAFMFEKEVR
jgi:hypothetical protein